VEAEPTATDMIAVPLHSSGRIIGVLALYDRSSSPFTTADLETIRTFAGQASVAVDNVLLHQEAQRLSVTDGLTGLSNYRAFQRQLAREVERATRFHRPLGLLLLDIDHFKTVNDTYGHQVGDEVLIELARRVQHEVRDVDSVGRYGGEELVVILPETDTDGAGLLAERICESVRRTPFEAGSTSITVTVSIGAAALPDHGTTPADLIRAADEAMYAVKGSGRDAWRVAELPADPAG
jgi:diguanylate cyclase (GGDEF)-like protein